MRRSRDDRQNRQRNGDDSVPHGRDASSGNRPGDSEMDVGQGRDSSSKRNRPGEADDEHGCDGQEEERLRKKIRVRKRTGASGPPNRFRSERQRQVKHEGRSVITFNSERKGEVDTDGAGPKRIKLKKKDPDANARIVVSGERGKRRVILTSREADADERPRKDLQVKRRKVKRRVYNAN
mmetsp:Transcript_3685/g.5277  ORF Transcript_3685/g.5277 Transcript_3685/m.5277 type:complete len:180 (-) Transcript_3685:126-665(-)